MTHDDLFLSSFYVQVISPATMASLSQSEDTVLTSVYRIRLPQPITEAEIIASIYREVVPGYDLTTRRPNWDTLLDNVWDEAMRQPHSQVLFLFDTFPIQTVEDVALLTKLTQVMLWVGTRIQQPHAMSTARAVSTRTAISCEVSRINLWPNPTLQPVT